MSGHCSDHTLTAVTTVYAKPMFAPGNADLPQLPLQTLYNHEDFVELISAQEFGLEALFPAKTLLCVAIAKRTDALDEMEAMITGCTTQAGMLASAQVQDDRINVSFGGAALSVANEETADDLLRALQHVPKAAWLAVLGAWCTGYRVVLYGTEEML